MLANIRLISAVLLAAAVAASPARADWQATRWNMSPEQVAEAMAGQAPLSRGSSRDRLGGKRVGNVGEYRSAEARFRTIYYYDAAGLAQITLVRRSGDCRAIGEALVRQHGQPIRVSDQVILRLLIWHDREARNRIRLMVSQAGICDVHYERLSDYEAHDLANPAR